jgi:hypothetical protein
VINNNNNNNNSNIINNNIVILSICVASFSKVHSAHIYCSRDMKTPAKSVIFITPSVEGLCIESLVCTRLVTILR